MDDVETMNEEVRKRQRGKEKGSWQPVEPKGRGGNFHAPANEKKI